MTKEQYFKALYEVQTPLRTQQSVVAAVAKKHGLGSYQYSQESKREAQIITNLYEKEMKLLWEFRTSCYVELVKKQGKESVLKQIINEGKQCEAQYKNDWRTIYKTINAL